MGAAEEISLRPSRTVRTGYFSVAALAAGSLLLLPLDRPAGAVSALAVMGVAAVVWRRFAAVQPAALRLREDGVMDRVDSLGNSTTVEVLSGSTVWAGLVVILGRAQGSASRSTTVVAADALEAEQFRSLRAWLRWRALSAEIRSPGPSFSRASRSRDNPD